MTDKLPNSEINSGKYKFYDVFSEGKYPSYGKSVTFVYCPTDSVGIFLYAVDVYGENIHPALYELGKEGLEVIPEDFDKSKISGGRISADRIKVTRSQTYKNIETPAGAIETFKTYLMDLDNK